MRLANETPSSYEGSGRGKVGDARENDRELTKFLDCLDGKATRDHPGVEEKASGTR